MMHVEDIRVVLWRYEPNPNWFRDIVSRAIVYFTGSDVTHAAIYVNSYIYESSVWTDAVEGFQHGARRIPWAGWLRTDAEENTMPDVYLYPVGISPEQVGKVQEWCEQVVTKGMRYNFLKLVAFMVVYYTRGLWNLIGWVPFSHDLFGEVCSTFVDKAFASVGIDLFPDRGEDCTVPGDFIHSPMLVSKNSIKKKVIGWDHR